MIAYFLYLKFKIGLLSLKKPWSLFITVILLLISWWYGMILAKFVDKLNSGASELFSAGEVTNYVLWALGIITLGRMIIPSYKPQQNIFPCYYPLSRIQHYIFSLTNDFFTPYFFYILLFLVSGSYYLETGKMAFFFSGLFVIISAHILRRLIQYNIDFKLKKNGYILFSVILAAMGGMLFFLPVLINYTWPKGVLVLVTLLVFGYLIDGAIIENRKSEYLNQSKHYNSYIKLIFNNAKARLPLIVGVIFKVVVLLILRIKITRDGSADGLMLIFWMFASPLITFTYVFNNIWGFWPDLWLNIETHTGRFLDFIKQGLRLLIFPLIIDMLVSIPILFITLDDPKLILSFYFTSMFYLVSFSFLWSLIGPKQIVKTFQFKGSTSIVGSMISIVGIFLLGTLKINIWFYLLIPLYVVISVLAIYLSFILYNEKKYKVTETITKK